MARPWHHRGARCCVWDRAQASSIVRVAGGKAAVEVRPRLCCFVVDDVPLHDEGSDHNASYSGTSNRLRRPFDDITSSQCSHTTNLSHAAWAQSSLQMVPMCDVGIGTLAWKLSSGFNAWTERARLRERSTVMLLTWWILLWMTVKELGSWAATLLAKFGAERSDCAENRAPITERKDYGRAWN